MKQKLNKKFKDSDSNQLKRDKNKDSWKSLAITVAKFLGKDALKLLTTTWTYIDNLTKLLGLF